MRKLLLFFLLFTTLLFAEYPNEYPYNSVVVIYADGFKLTGIIVSENQVLTCYHGKAQDIFVYKYPAEVVKIYASFDLMLLKTKQTFDKKRVAKLAKTIKIKETIWIIGYPRYKTKPKVFKHNVAGIEDGYIETFPYVIGGNSGSGAFNEKDELVGIVVKSYFGMTIVPSIYTIKYFLGKTEK